MSARWRLVVLGFAVLLPIRALAADLLPAAVTVAVVADPGVVATVELTGASHPTPRWQTTVAGGERRTFNGLIADRYHVKIAVPGSAETETTVDVTSGDVALVEVTPRGGAAPRVDVVFRNKPSQGGAFGAEELRNLPAGNSLNALIDTAVPFVIADRIDNGGLATGDWARVGSRGSSWTSARLYVGDEEITGPNARGIMPFYPDLSAMEAVNVVSGLADPLIATPGAAIVLAPRRPGAERHLSIAGAFTTPGMVTSASAAPAPLIGSVNNWHDAAFVWSGPLTSRVGAVFSASTGHVEAERRGQSVVSSRTASFTAHVVASPSDRDEVRVFASAQNVRRPFDVAPAVVGAVEQDRLGGAQLTWDRRNNNGAWRSLSIGFRRGAFTPNDIAAVGGTVDRAIDGPVPAPTSRDVTQSVNARVTLAPADRRIAGLGHSARASFELRRTNATADTFGSPVFAELAAGVPARAWIATSPASGSRRHVTSAVVALNDDIAFSRRLTLTLGVRGDVSSGAATGASTDISWRSASPLAALRWAPNWLTMTAGYRRYARQLSTDLLAFGDPGEPEIDVYRWTDADADTAFDAAERGVLVARAGRSSSLAAIAAGLRPSHTDEYSLRAERRLGGSHYLRVTATVRRESEILRSVNTGAPLSAYTARSVPNQIEDPKRARDGLLTVYDRRPETFGQDFYVLSNAPGEGARYRGLEIAWEMRSRRWYSMAGASAYESSGLGGNRGFRVDEADAGVIGELFENPNAESVADSRAFFDRAYVLKWSTVYRGPRGLTAGITARYQDGQAFARMVLVPELAQGAEIVASDHSVATRFSFTGTIDAHLAKTFSLKNRGTIALALDVFNLSNLADEVEENAVSGPTFRVSTAMQPTRTVRLGLRFGF